MNPTRRVSIVLAAAAVILLAAGALLVQDGRPWCGGLVMLAAPLVVVAARRAMRGAPPPAPVPDAAVAARLAATEERLEVALEHGYLIAFEWDIPADRVQRVHSLVEALAPTTPGEAATFAHVLAVAHPDDRDRFERAVRDAVAGRTPRYESEHRYVRPDGTDRWVRETGRVVRDAQGRPLRLIGVTADIDERKRAEARLRESEETFRATFEHSALGVAIVGLEGHFLRVNQAFAAMTGYTPGELVDRTFSQITHPEDLAADLQLARRLAAGDVSTYALEKRYLRPDGSVVWVELHASAVRDASGAPVHYIATIADITERRRVEAQLREADRRKNEFLATLAHELRNPLAPLRNAAELLRLQSQGRPSLQPVSEMIDRQLTHLVRLIDDLLDVGRITRGRLELRRAPVTLASVVEQAVEGVLPHVERAGHALTLALPERPVHLHADGVRLAQVLGNLLHNAAKYMEPNGRIELTAAVERDQVVIRVRDHGIGIAPENLGRIFDMFSQVDSARVRSQGGLGIGLALARGLVEMHDGRIEAHSEGPGKGSEFVVRLPLMAAPAAGLARPAPAPALAAAVPPQRKVLVVDDGRDTADSLAALLAAVGHEVVVAYDGAEALARAEACRPDVILLDLGLPTLDGYQVCEAIRATPWGRDITIVALSGWGQDADRERSRRAGFDRHLVKPADYDALVEVLASA